MRYLFLFHIFYIIYPYLGFIRMFSKHFFFFNWDTFRNFPRVIYCNRLILLVIIFKNHGAVQSGLLFGLETAETGSFCPHYLFGKSFRLNWLFSYFLCCNYWQLFCFSGNPCKYKEGEWSKFYTHIFCIC